METLEKLSKLLNKPVEELLKRLEEAGIEGKNAKDSISQAEKNQLIASVIKSAPRGGHVRRKTVMTKIKLSGKAGSGTVMVETIKSRNLPKPPKPIPEPEPLPEPISAEPEVTVEAVAVSPEATTDPKPESLMDAVSDTAKAAEEAATLETSEAKETEASPVDEKKARTKPDPKEKQAAASRTSKPQSAKETRKPAGKKEPTKGRLKLNMELEKAKRRRPRIKRAGSRVYSAQVHQFELPTSPVKREVQIPGTIDVTRLAEKLAMKASELTKQMMGMGVMVTINQSLDQDTAVLVVEELGHVALPITEMDVEEKFNLTLVKNTERLVPRPPVITVMGHVDHGKTSLLDKLRKSNTAGSESGGITQHIGAYQLSYEYRGSKKLVTFLDTPGHAAFSSMRARGAKVTDIVVLVVAADDGVKPQTVEAITHAQEAKVPIIVALNKIDRESCDPEKVKAELAKHEIVSESWGGKNLFVETSATTGKGIDALMEAILLQSEVMELEAPIAGNARGVVVESSLERGRGAVATVLVQSGCLKPSHVMLCGSVSGKVRTLSDEHGKTLKEALPSTPVVVLGLSGPPEAGDEMNVVDSERVANEVSDFRKKKKRARKLSQTGSVLAEDIFKTMERRKKKSLILLVKADVKGSAEALHVAFTALRNDEIETKIIASGIGGITESDVNLAATSKATVIGFRVRADTQARVLAREMGVSLLFHNIIYEALDSVREILLEALDPVYKEKVLGYALVKDIFPSSVYGLVAGCQVTEGTVQQGGKVRVLRASETIYEGALESLRHFRDDVKEVTSGTECGIAIKNYQDIQAGDRIMSFEHIRMEKTL